MHLGDIIKQYRNEHDLSMQAFADRCGVSKGYVAMLERNVNSKTGEPVTPSIETFIKVAKAMNVTTAELFDKVDENTPVSLSAENSILINNTMLITAEENGLEQASRMLKWYLALNAAGKAKADDYLQDLSEQDKYTNGE